MEIDKDMKQICCKRKLISLTYFYSASVHVQFSKRKYCKKLRCREGHSASVVH